MALPQAQLQANVATQNAVPHPKYSGGAIFNDKPSTKGNILLEQVSNYADSISRGGQSLGANLRGTDQGAPGTPGAPGNAVVQAQYLDRCEASRSLLLSAIDPESQLYRTCSDAVFARGDQIWTYLNGPQIVYIAPSRKEAQDHIHTVKTWTWESLPRDEQNRNLVINFKSKVVSHNPERHTTFDIPAGELLDVFANGLHPQAKVTALNYINNPAAAAAANLNHPANFPAHHPNAWNPLHQDTSGYAQNTIS